MITASGDNAAKPIFKVLGDPKTLNRFQDKKVLFLVMTVAVNPGWRTRKGYAADIAVLTSYQPSAARLDVVKNFTPTSMSPSPEASGGFRLWLSGACHPGGHDQTCASTHRSKRV